MEKIFLDKFEGNLTFIVPCIGFFLPKEFEDGLTSRSKFGNELVDVL